MNRDFGVSVKVQNYPSCFDILVCLWSYKITFLVLKINNKNL